MAYLMSDVATGGQAALQLQQQMAAAPNVQQVEANKMQEQQLILQQNEAKLQQEAATLQKTKLANLVAETGIKGDEESKQKLQALYKTPEFQTALNDNDYGNLIRLTGGAMMSSGKVEEGAKILVQASSFDAKKIADKQKMMDQNAQEIGNAYGVLSAIDSKNPQKIEEAFTNLPKESKDALISQVGESNWKRFTPQEKLEATKNLMLNAKGQLAIQLKLADIERQILINESKERVANENNKTRIATKELGDSGIKQDREKRLTWEETTRAITSIEKSGSKTLERLNEAVDAADAAVIKAKPGSLASFFGATGDFDTANELLTKAKQTRDDFQRKQIKKQLDIAVSAPDFSSKVVVVRELQTQLAALGGPTPLPSPKVEEAKPVSGSPLPPGLPMGTNAPQAVKDKVMTAPGASQAAAKADLSGVKTHDGYPARKNSDGSYSTELSITVTNPKLNNGKPTNIPSLWKGKEVDEDTAVENVLASGKKYESFSTIPEAVKAAKERSKAGGAGAVPSNKYTQDNPAKPTSKEEYDKLPGGSYYIQDGVIKRKKG